MQFDDNTILIRVIVEDEVFTHFIDKEEFVIGRSEDCELSISIEGISRHHLKVLWQEGKLFIQDLGSRY